MNIERLKEIAIEVMLSEGELVNTVFVELAEKIMVLPVPLTNPRFKHQQMAIAGLVAAKQLGKKAKSVSSFGFVTEAWLTRHFVKDIKEGQIPSPSEDPNRIEILLIVSMKYPSLETMLKIVEIKRHGKAMELIETPNNTPDEMKADILEAFVRGFQEGVK